MKTKLTRILFGSAALALLACQASAEGKISGITTKPVSDGLEVQINGIDLTAPKITRVMGGRSFMLEFDASLSSDPQWIRVEQNGVHYVQSVWSQSSPAKIRIHLRVDPDTRIDVTPDAGGFLVKAESGMGVKKAAVSAPVEKGSITVYRTPQHLAMQPAPTHTEHVQAVTGGPGRTISLDFVNTDIVQILKALAMEAGVNIVTSPDVKGALTVSLSSVSIKQALDLVTTMDALKYAQIGDTYVVSGSANFGDLIAKLGGKAPSSSVTRVVPIYSGEGIHIKDALRTTTNDVEILLPSDKPLTTAAVAQATQTVNGASLADFQSKTPGGAGGAGAAAAGGAAPAPTDTKGATKDAYLILVGPASRIDMVEQEVKSVDEQLCAVLDIEVPLSNTMIREVYHPQGTAAAILLQTVAATTDKTTGGDYHAKVGTVEIYATPNGSTSEQSIVLFGRETEVNRLMETLKSLDSLSQSDGNYTVYAVKYLDPRALREDIVAKFPGLSVNIPAASVINTSVYQAGQNEKQNEEKAGQSIGTNNQASNSNTNSVSGAGSSNTLTSQTDNGQNAGLTAPFAGDELNGVPMKLVLHGAPELITDAIAYLNAIDVEPKQVALELRVMELSKEDALQLGINWDLLTGGTVQSLNMNQSGPATPYPLIPGSGAGAVTNTPINPVLTAPGISGTLQGLAKNVNLGVTATLDQLASSNKMIARPNILALDGRESEMFVGDDVKYIEQIQSTQNGVSITTGDVEVGVKLAVLPRIGGNNDISMELRPEVSTLLSFTQVPGGGEIPETGLRIAQSTMVIHDGDTIAIGGLIQDTDKKERDGIPILKDIPILNLLFSSVNNDHQRDEVVFFLTAHVVDGNSIHNAANPMYGEPLPQMPKKKRH